MSGDGRAAPRHDAKRRREATTTTTRRWGIRRLQLAGCPGSAHGLRIRLRPVVHTHAHVHTDTHTFVFTHEDVCVCVLVWTYTGFVPASWCVRAYVRKRSPSHPGDSRAIPPPRWRPGQLRRRRRSLRARPSAVNSPIVTIRFAVWCTPHAPFPLRDIIIIITRNHFIADKRRDRVVSI